MSEVVEEVPAETPQEPTPAPETPSEPEPEPEVPFEEPEPEQPAEQVTFDPESKESRELARKLKQSVTTYRNAVERLLPEQWPYLTECELCDEMVPGYHFPAELVQPRDELHAHLLAVLNNPAQPEYKQAQHVRNCATCDGWGKVKSGSRVAGKELVVCPTCKGTGFQGDATVQQPTFTPTVTPNGDVEVAFPADVQPLVTDDVDAWGSPRLLDDGQENPNWGRMPQYKQAGLP